MKDSISAFSILLIGSILIVTSGVAGGATTVEEVAAGLMCPCPDNCNQMLSTCQCGDADRYRAEIRERLTKGETKDQITAWFVGKYGEKALSAPTTHGFNITAWIMPFIALLVGGVILRSVLIKWKKRSEEETEVEEKTHEKDEDDPYLRRVEKELEEYE
jgi:cytochrome c-type biogenesis protein CcmH